MKAIFSGSFDPITIGHLDIIERASKMFDTLYVGICVNSEKKSTFSLDDRRKMADKACEGLSNVKVVTVNGLLAEFTEANDISVIVRGLRDSSDLSYEMPMAVINRSLRNHPETIFVPTKPEHSHISSSYVKDMIKYGESVDTLLPESVIKFIKPV